MRLTPSSFAATLGGLVGLLAPIHVLSSCLDGGQTCSLSSDCCSGICLGDQTCLFATATLSCPNPGSSANVGLPNGGTLEVGLSSAGTLCTLTEVQSEPSDPSKDIQIIPIGRTYDGRSWENIAGSYSEAIFPNGPPSCTSMQCTIPLPAEAHNSRYVLTSYDHSLAKRDEIARFLDQVTFGVKTSELNAEEAAHDAAVDADHWRAQYVKDQVDPAQTPMTSHREWWRKRTNPKMTHSAQNGRSDGPCDRNSRWRRYTFSREDMEKVIVDERKSVHFYTPVEDDGLPNPVIYEAEDLILIPPAGMVPLVDTLNEQTNGFYDLCEGDCDSDSDCADDLVCYQRNAFEPVPGCYGHGSYYYDYCIDLEALVGETPLNFTGNPLNPNPGGKCEGDCDADSQCAGELRCLSRTNGGPVPGCYGHDLFDASDDFCYDPKTSWTEPPYFGYEIDSTPNNGHTGTSYLDHRTGSNSWAEWTISVDTAGTYHLSLRYSSLWYYPSSDGLMFVEMIVNEGSQHEQVEQLLTAFSHGSGDWRYTKYMEANLQAGSNRVKIRNMQEKGANIDHLRVGKAKSTIIEVDGHFRTVVHDRVRYMEGIEANSDGQTIEYSDNSTKHPYEVCSWPSYYNVKYMEGKLQVRPQGDSGCGNAQMLDTMNPLVDFTGYENYVPGVVFNLPDLSNSSVWAPVADEEDYYKLMPGYDFILKEGIQDDLCAEVPVSVEESDAPILAKLSDGTWLQWTGQLILEENTVESPYSDGGGAIVNNTDNTKCMNAPRNFLNEEGCILSNSLTACAAEDREFPGGATIICGSTGEVANDHSQGQLFNFAFDESDFKTTGSAVMQQQKTKAWTHIALEAQDQLRQKMAWALCQIFTIVEDVIGGSDGDTLTEIYLNYYDICVRHAFGNLRDVLKEASYSPLMATHLTFLASKSTAYIFDDEDGKVTSPDENYAREVMQLFTIGLERLNADGTPQRDEDGRVIQTYTNEDIMSFARAWTGFQAYKVRGNHEHKNQWVRNLLDPLYIEGSWRDRFPKHDLTGGGYIGDTFPLCVDMPNRAFLRKGAKYRLLGSNSLPELMVDHPDLQVGNQYPDIKRMVLSTSSDLYAELYNGGNYQAVVTLMKNLDCEGNECDVDTVRVVQVATNPDIFYEYIALPCVHQAFYKGGKQIAREYRASEGVMCADPRLPAASEACGNQDILVSVKDAFRSHKYTGERMTYATAEARCASQSSTLPVTALDDHSVGDNQGTGAYGHCQGDCDSDSDCQGNMICFSRGADEPVPGCHTSVGEKLPVISLDDSVGNNQGTGAYGHCQGDCDADSDCEGNLVCFQRSGHDEVPGCNMTVEALPVIPLDDTVGNNQGTGAYGFCQGDCDSDSDCQGDLVCYNRDAYDPVPGCSSAQIKLPVIPLDDSVGNNKGTGAYGHCQGDCDRDSDCQGHLVCFQRSGHDEVPGCNMTVEGELLPAIPLDQSVGNNQGTGAYGHCQGDCDADTDCQGNLVCFQRSGYEDVPGCDMSAGAGGSGWDFCIQPAQLGTHGSDYCVEPDNFGFDYCVQRDFLGTAGTDYCVQPDSLGTHGTDYCVDPMYESGIIKFGGVSGADYELGYHWTSFDCSIQAKINTEGYVALVHETDNMNSIPPHLDAEQSVNYFKVYWEGNGTYPSPATGCGHCKLSNNADACICPTNVVDEVVFSAEPATVEDIISSLHIGAVPPDIAGPSGTFTSQMPSNKGFTVHFPAASSGIYNAETIFELNHPYHGAKFFLKNTKSTVHLEGWSSLPTILEAEDAIAGGPSNPKGGWLCCPKLVLANETSRGRFRGNGFMEFPGVDQGYLNWTINVPAAIVATISFRFENSWGPPQVVNVFVNDNAIDPEGTKLSSTGRWDYWMDSESFPVMLSAGDNVIQLKYSGPWTGPKIDYLKIEWPSTQSSYSFRNAPHFMSLSRDYDDDGEGETTARDAHYETDAVLDHYYYHPNTAPFICIRLIQRHGISNPSPGYIKTCSEAFRSGTYSSGGQIFGSSEYGSLEAVAAAITLEPEATSTVLDADPGHGRIREPFLQPIQMLRSLEAELVPQENHFELWELFGRLGQEPHHFESVFSFFLPEYVPDVGPSIVPGYVAPESMVANAPNIVARFNGLLGLVKYGISDCYDDTGFGKDPGYGKCLDDGSMQRASAFFSYTPGATTTVELIQELNTLLCAGRLSQSKQNIIVAECDSFNPAYDSAGAKLRFAYQLIISTPEFHTSTVVKEDSTKLRPVPSVSSSGVGNNGYKAVIFFYLSGGLDSFNMLPPYTCEDGLYEKYVDIRGGLSTAADPGIALPKESLWEITTNNAEHVCSSVGLHQKLSHLKDLYDQGDALFVTNTGLMEFPVTKDNYRDTNVPLFAHNSMCRETMREDLGDEEFGTGVLGRIRDKLSGAGFSSHTYSLSGSQISLIGAPGVTDGPMALSSDGVQKLMPRLLDDLTPDMKPYLLGFNNATSIDSSFMAETWSAKVSNTVYQHEEMYNALQGTSVTANFADSSGRKSSLCKRLEMVARVMATRQTRGVERDLFHVETGGFDDHSMVIEGLEESFENINLCLNAFVEEVKNMGLWNDTVLIEFSEFGRTLIPNSGPEGDGTGKGSDHAWGGHQFAIGGGLKGGQVLGQYPDDFTENGPLALSRGRIIPTTPWDAIWSGVAPWMGVPGEDMDYVLPMRDNFESSVLFTEGMLFNP